MAINASFVLSVTPLPETDAWFVNSDAWTNYWANVEGEIIFEAIPTSVYVESPFDTNLAPDEIVIDDTVFDVCTIDQLASLVAMVNALNNSYKLLRTALRDAGLITNAQ